MPEHILHDAITDWDITQAMSIYGGSFVRVLGQLWPLADDDNRARLKAAFPEYWQQYAELLALKRGAVADDPRRV